MPLVLRVTQDAPQHEVRAGDYVVIRGDTAGLWRDLPDGVAHDLVLMPVAVVAAPLSPPALRLPSQHPPLYRRLLPVGLWLIP